MSWKKGRAVKRSKRNQPEEEVEDVEDVENEIPVTPAPEVISDEDLDAGSANENEVSKKK